MNASTGRVQKLPLNLDLRRILLVGWRVSAESSDDALNFWLSCARAVTNRCEISAPNRMFTTWPMPARRA